MILMHWAREHTLSEEQAGGAVCGGKHKTLGGDGASLGRVCEAGARPAARGKAMTRELQGGRHAQQIARMCRSGRL